MNDRYVFLGRNKIIRLARIQTGFILYSFFSLTKALLTHAISYLMKFSFSGQSGFQSCKSVLTIFFFVFFVICSFSKRFVSADGYVHFFSIILSVFLVVFLYLLNLCSKDRPLIIFILYYYILPSNAIQISFRI